MALLTPRDRDPKYTQKTTIFHENSFEVRIHYNIYSQLMPGMLKKLDTALAILVNI